MEQAEPENIYEQLSRLIYTYHFGRISYLDLLEQFEELMGLSPPQTDQQAIESTPPQAAKKD